MTWKDVDLFEMVEASSFSNELYHVIVPLFEQGQAALQNWERERKVVLERMLADADGEDDERYASAVADQEELHNIQRSRVFGTAGLQFLYSALKYSLQDISRYFDQKYPRASGRYEGKGKMTRLRNEYHQRFGIDFEGLPHFANMRELELARNAGIHPSAGTLQEYTDKVSSPRFCRDGEFIVESDAFMQLVGEVDRFFNSVVHALAQIRRANRVDRQ